MTSSNFSSRRRFLVQATTQASAIGIVGGLSVRADDLSVQSEQTPKSQFSRVLNFTVPGKHAIALAVGPKDQIYVAVDRQVKIFDRDGTHHRTLDFRKLPRGLAVDSKGTLYVAMARGIEVVHVNDERDQWSPPVNNVWLNSLTINSSEVCVADSASKVVWRFDRTGTVLGRYVPFTGNSTTASEFFAITASEGRLHIADPRRHQVAAFDAAGQCEHRWGIASRELAGFSGCCNPVSLAIRDDGRIVTAERGILRVKLFSDQGVFISLIAGPEYFATSSVSEKKTESDCATAGLIVAVDASRRTIVLDPASRLLQVFV